MPVIAEQASHLTVFQRTANFSIPARNAALTAEEREAFRAKYPEIRRFAREVVAQRHLYRDARSSGALDDGDNERRAKYEARWSRGGLTFMSVYNNLALDKAANDTAADFVREKIAEIVKDPQTAKLLQPEQSSDRIEAHLHRFRLLRDVQPSERDAGRYPVQSDRGDFAERRAHQRKGL